MINRIVKMTFTEQGAQSFQVMFEEVKHKIRAFEGCEYLELWNDINEPNVFFTYSKWQSVDALENYRQSDLFSTTWKQTKSYFADKPQAWSVNSLHQLA